MGRAYNVIDADGHILEPLDLWDNYIDPAFRDRAPRIVKGENGKERLVIEEQTVGDGQRGIGRIGAVGARQGVVEADTMAYKDGKPGGFDPHKRIPDMDADGIDAAFLYPSSACSQAPYTIRNSPPRRAAPTTVGLPITASPIPTGCSAWRCCRCRMSI
jgi:hypothetical protein